VRIGSSRSFNVNDFGTNRKRTCDFLLVRHSLVLTVSEMRWLIGWKLLFFSYRSPIWRHRSLCSLWNSWWS